MWDKGKRARAFILLLYAVAVLELVLAVTSVVHGRPLAALLGLAIAVATSLGARALWRDFLRCGENDWRYSWRALYRKLRD
jgi:hypothetical protein